MTGSITRRGGSDRDGRWQLRVPTGGGTPATRMFHGSRRQAEHALNLFVAEVEQDRTGGDRMTLATLLERFVADRQQRHRADSTVDHYRTYADAWTAALGRKPIGAITPEDLETFYATLTGRGGAPAAPATIAKYHATIRGAYNMAIDRRWTRYNPAPATARPTIRRAKIQVPTPAEVRMLLTCAPLVNPQIDMFLTLAVDSWARRSEVCAIRRTDISLERGEVLIQHALTAQAALKPTKTHSRRLLSLAPATLDKLADYYDRMEKHAANLGFRWRPDAFLFAADPEGAAPGNPNWASSDYEKVKAKASVDGVRLGALRHFGPTQALQHGMNIVAVSHRLGHRLVSTTLDHYAEFIPASDQALSGLMGSLMAAPSVGELEEGGIGRTDTPPDVASQTEGEG